MNTPLVVQLSGPATRFVTLLREFGHLEDRATADLLLAAAAAASEGPDAGQTVDLHVIRHIAAQYLAATQAQALADGHGILNEDWPLLFS